MKGNKTTTIANAISINMLPSMGIEDEVNLKIKKIKEPSAEEKANMTSVIGHPSTAAVVGVPANRANYKFAAGDTLIVAQYIGPRLEEGVTELPDGASIEYFQITLS